MMIVGPTAWPDVPIGFNAYDCVGEEIGIHSLIPYDVKIMASNTSLR